MTRRPWERFLTERDREIFELSGYGAEAGLLDRPALLVIDVTRAFVGDRPEELRQSVRRFRNSCGTEGWEAMERLVPVLAAFRAAGLPVIYTRMDRAHPFLDRASWGAKNARAHEDAEPASGDDNEIPQLVAPLTGEVVVEKGKPSAFFASVTGEYLVRLGVNQLVCCGTTTSGCVRATVVDAFSLGYRVAVIEDCTFDRGEASHAISLFDMQQKYADLITADQAVAYAAARSG